MPFKAAGIFWGFVIFLVIVKFIKRLERFVDFFILASPILPGFSHYLSIFQGTFLGISIIGVLNIFLPVFTFSYVFIIRKISPRLYSLHWPILFFLFALTISTVFSYTHLRGLRELFRLTMPLMLYYLLPVYLSRRGDIHKSVLRILHLILLSSIVPICFGFWQLIKGDVRYLQGDPQFVVLGFHRIFGTLNHPNAYAVFLIIVFFVAAFLLMNTRSAAKKFICFVFILSAVCSLFFTFSRIGWVAFLSSLSIFGLLRYRRLYFLFGLMFFFIMLIPDVSRMAHLRIKPDSSFYGRFELNKLSWQIFLENPVLGQGLASYIHRSQSGSIGGKQEYGQVVGLGQHNDYWKFLTESGLMGFFAYLCLISASLRLSFKVCRQKDPICSSVGITTIAVITSMLVVGFSDMGFQMTGIYLWLLLGIGEYKIRWVT